MKYLCTSLAAILLVVMVFSGTGAVNAAESDFSTETLSENEENIIRSNAEIVPLGSPPRKLAIRCFDVNTDGMIVVGTSNGETKTIAVYDANGIYQYGFLYRVSGDFGVQWDGKNILIYSVRGDIAFCVNPDGEIEEIREIKNTTENNAYWHHVVFARERTVGDSRYKLKNNMGMLNFFTSSYSQLVCIHSDGSEQVIYDVNTEQLIKMVIIILCVILFAAITLLTVYKQFRKMNQV